jgi:hypothetical protein
MKKHLLAGLLALAPHALAAHEFWIEPETYAVAPGGRIVADLKVGEDFAGSTFSFNPRSFSRFDMAQAGAPEPVPGRPGDRPAVQIEAPGAGLLIFAHETEPQQVTYSAMADFEAFLAHKDWSQLRAVHEARGWPEAGFAERYTRHVKSLVAVGDGSGTDRVLGLQTEIVALANPYTDAAETLPVQVFLEGAPRADAQVELFEKAPDGSVTVSLHRTDAEGVATLPVSAGHSYLVDAVVIRPLEPSATAPELWESLWAGLTFAVP